MIQRLFRKILIDYSAYVTWILVAVALAGAYVSKDIELKLSLTDLLPQDHPSVVKFNELTKIVGGVGYVEVLLHAEDTKAHLKFAPELVKKLKANPLVRSAFYLREEHFFLQHALYYGDVAQLRDLEKSVSTGITRAKRKFFDIGLWDDDKDSNAKRVELDPEMKKVADKTVRLSEHLISTDRKDLLIMIKPSFDSMEMGKSKALIHFLEETLPQVVPKDVSFRISGRYFTKVKDAEVIEKDIFILGLLSNVVMAVLLLLYFRSIRSVISIFIPVFLGLGITALITRYAIGHINIITGFLVGILAGVGSDYGIHLLWRIRLELKEPSGPDPDPLWRTLMTSGWANFVTIVSSGLCFFMMCGSSFKVFSEFGFLCGVGLTAILVAKMGTFYYSSKLLKLETIMLRDKYPFAGWRLPQLKSPAAFRVGMAVTILLMLAAVKVNFEFDFDRMLEHSEEARAAEHLSDVIYERSTTPSAFAAKSQDTARGIEKYLKAKYVPDVVSSIVNGGTIIPDQQEEKQPIVARIRELVRPLNDNQLSASAEIPAAAIRTWVNAKPIKWDDLPVYVQEALRGTDQAEYLIYVYPKEALNNGPAVAKFAAMIKDVEKKFPDVVSGSDAGIFSDILGLIERDGIVLMTLITICVAIFIWITLGSFKEMLLSYVPFLVSLPASIGLMAIFGVKFNIFNVALIPAFLAIGIEIPIQLMQRAREVKSGFKAVHDIAVSLQLSLVTTAVGFGILVFTRAGVLKSLGWMSIMATFSIWAVGMFLHPAIIERYFQRESRKT